MDKKSDPYSYTVGDLDEVVDEKGNAHISIGADKYFLFTDTLIDYDDIDLKKLESDSEYAADLIAKCLTTLFNYKNFLEELSLKQLAKFLDMTKVIVR